MRPPILGIVAAGVVTAAQAGPEPPPTATGLALPLAAFFSEVRDGAGGAVRARFLPSSRCRGPHGLPYPPAPSRPWPHERPAPIARGAPRFSVAAAGRRRAVARRLLFHASAAAAAPRRAHRRRARSRRPGRAFCVDELASTPSTPTAAPSQAIYAGQGFKAHLGRGRRARAHRLFDPARAGLPPRRRPRQRRRARPRRRPAPLARTSRIDGGVPARPRRHPARARRCELVDLPERRAHAGADVVKRWLPGSSSSSSSSSPLPRTGWC